MGNLQQWINDGLDPATEDWRWFVALPLKALIEIGGAAVLAALVAAVATILGLRSPIELAVVDTFIPAWLTFVGAFALVFNCKLSGDDQ
jgi:hypothetical protein